MSDRELREALEAAQANVKRLQRELEAAREDTPLLERLRDLEAALETKDASATALRLEVERLKGQLVAAQAAVRPPRDTPEPAVAKPSPDTARLERQVRDEKGRAEALERELVVLRDERQQWLTERRAEAEPLGLQVRKMTFGMLTFGVIALLLGVLVPGAWPFALPFTAGTVLSTLIVRSLRLPAEATPRSRK